VPHHGAAVAVLLAFVPVDAGRDDGDAHLIAQLIVDDGAKDDVGVGVRRLGEDDLGRLVHFKQPEVGGARHVEQDAARAPSMLDSSSGLAIAARAALMARPSPDECPMPTSAVPASFITMRTSAKSVLMRTGGLDEVGDALHALQQGGVSCSSLA
jgi:hypothetical protein